MKDINIARLFFTHGLASMSGSLISAVYFLVDAIFIGHMVGPEALAASSLSFPLLLLVGASGQVIIRGTSALFSECLGSDPEGLTPKIWPALLCWGCLVPLFFAILISILARPLLCSLLPDHAQTVELAVPYLRIYAFNYVLITINLGLIGLLRCEGKGFAVALLFAETTSLNLSLDYLFLGGLELGLPGAALACTIANLVSIIHAYALLRASPVLKMRAKLGFYLELLCKILRRGSYTFILQILTILQQGLLYRLVAGSGQVALVAVMGATLNIQNFVLSPMFGLSFSFQSVLGIAYGEKDSQRVRKVFWTYLSLTTGVCLIFSLFLISQSNSLLLYFVNAKPIVETYVSYFSAGIWGIVSYGSLIIVLIYLQTLHQLREVLILIVCRFALQILLAVCFSLKFGPFGLFVSLSVSDFLTFFLTIILISTRKHIYIFSDKGVR